MGTIFRFVAGVLLEFHVSKSTSVSEMYFLALRLHSCRDLGIRGPFAGTLYT